MYHSITIGGKNTYTDWHLVPASRPVINPPKPKTQYVDIPGADGSIDLTESLAGRPVFSDREGSIEFYVLNDYDIDNYHYNWSEVYSNVMRHLHGRYLKMSLEDDPDYYYEGRFTVNGWKSDANHSTITIDYRLSPYKYLNADAPVYEIGDIGEASGGNVVSANYIRTASPLLMDSGDNVGVEGYRFNFFRYSADDPAIYTGGNHADVSLTKGTYMTIGAKAYYRFSFRKNDSTAFSEEDLSKLKAAVTIHRGGKF